MAPSGRRLESRYKLSIKGNKLKKAPKGSKKHKYFFDYWILEFSYLAPPPIMEGPFNEMEPLLSI